MTSYLIWSLFTHSDKIEILVKIVHQLQAAKTIIEKRTSYETAFAGSTRVSQYFRFASMLRYKMFEITTRVKKEKEEEKEEKEKEKQLKANEKLRSRYFELDFRVFCFIATYLPPLQMASIDDEAWPYFIQWVLEYIRMMEIPEKFAEIAVLRLQTVNTDLANAFEREWKESWPVWIKYHNLLCHQITKQQTNLNKELEELVQCDELAPNELLQKIGELKARYSGELRATATQLKGHISLSDEERDQHKIRLMREHAQLRADLKNGLEEIAQRKRGPEGRLEDMESFIAHFERKLSMEERASPISLAPKIIHEINPPPMIPTKHCTTSVTTNTLLYLVAVILVLISSSLSPLLPTKQQSPRDLQAAIHRRDGKGRVQATGIYRRDFYLFPVIPPRMQTHPVIRARTGTPKLSMTPLPTSEI